MLHNQLLYLYFCSAFFYKYQGSRLSSAPYSRAACGERLARRESELAWFRGQIVILFKCSYAIGFDGISSLFLAKLTNDVPREHPDTFPQEILESRPQNTVHLMLRHRPP